MLRTLSAALLLAVLSSAPAAAQTTGCPVEEPTNPALQPVVDQINALRKTAGVAPLALNTLLTKAAQGHADDMARNNYFSHTSRDGRSAGQRITAAGYSWSSWAENIAWGQADWAAVVRGWTNSAGHRANMLNPRYRDIGLGVSNRKYVANFASPR